MHLLLACTLITMFAPAALPVADGGAAASPLAPAAEGSAAGSSLATPAAERPAGAPATPASAEIAAIMADVFEWQMEHLEPPSDTGWIQSTLMIGVVAAFEATGDERYLGAAIEWAERNDWQLGPRVDHADDHGAAQVYLDLSRISDDPAVFEPAQGSFDALLETSVTGRELWSWCDALFMTPPALARLSAATGDTMYLNAMDAWWWDATGLLYDREERLFHRDEEARSEVNERGVRSRWGNKLIWSRGNGWVLAGLARVLPFLPAGHPSRGDYISLYSEMAAKVATLQGDDGLWGASLFDPRDSLPPETSGSALFCYALAWGINEGILPRETYLPIVETAWGGLVSCIGEDGALGWVQPLGRRPALSFADGTAPYGSGAFLLAGSEMLGLE